MKPKGEHCIKWIKWDTLCQQKEHGGLGFKNLLSFNLAMLSKHGWNLLSSPHTLASRFIKAKYFPNWNFLLVTLGSNLSFIWKSIWSKYSILKLGCRWRIGDERSINVWHAAWVKEDDNRPPPPPPPPPPLLRDLRSSEYVIYLSQELGSGTWSYLGNYLVGKVS